MSVEHPYWANSPILRHQSSACWRPHTPTGCPGWRLGPPPPRPSRRYRACNPSFLRDDVKKISFWGWHPYRGGRGGCLAEDPKIPTLNLKGKKQRLNWGLPPLFYVFFQLFLHSGLYISGAEHGCNPDFSFCWDLWDGVGGGELRSLFLNKRIGSNHQSLK